MKNKLALDGINLKEDRKKSNKNYNKIESQKNKDELETLSNLDKELVIALRQAGL